MCNDFIFIGSCDTEIDEENRFVMPISFRDDMNEGFCIFKGFVKKCIWIMPENYFKKWIKQFDKKIPGDSLSGQVWLRVLSSSVIRDKMDESYRVSLSKELIDYAGIEKKIKIIGMDNKVEIWPLEKWNSITEDFFFEEVSDEVTGLYDISSYLD